MVRSSTSSFVLLRQAHRRTFEQLTGDMTGVNYSSARVASIEFRRRRRSATAAGHHQSVLPADLVPLHRHGRASWRAAGDGDPCSRWLGTAGLGLDRSR